MGEEWFRQEYLCEFLDVGGALFDRDTIERAFTHEIAPLEW
jgi:phage FluMu gp28-like protein